MGDTLQEGLQEALQDWLWLDEWQHNCLLGDQWELGQWHLGLVSLNDLPLLGLLVSWDVCWAFIHCVHRAV